ncbi:MAG: lycopene cyclase [Myxococcota bacterium]
MQVPSNDSSLDYARERVAESGGRELLERLEHLDAQRQRVRPAPDTPPSPDRETTPDYDVALVGGGLSILVAPILAAQGAKVAVFERAKAGKVHREWNASVSELDALVRSGLFERHELDELIIKTYDYGFCRWNGLGTYPVKGVLDTPVDAGLLLERTRERAVSRGVAFFDRHTLLGQSEGPTAMRLRFESGGAVRDVTARLMIDGRGASSPYATADLVCPTVGGVLAGLDEGDGPRQINPNVGEILETTEGLEDGRQHIWEGFPGRPDETTTYLFYYAASSEVGPGALIRLYDRFFETLPRYKTGAYTMLRPTFGFIPGWSRLSAAPQAPGSRIALIGDAASRHSPLTFCGFGCMLRSLQPATTAVTDALNRRWLREGDLACIVDDAPVHRGSGLLSWMMAHPDRRPGRENQLNILLDTAFSVLYELGDEVYAAMLKDEIGMKDFARFLHRTSMKRPRVYKDVFGRLGPSFVGRWGVSIAREIAGGRTSWR